MDKDSEESSDNLPSIDVRSRMAFFEHLNKTQESSQPQTKLTRRGQPPQKQAYQVSKTTAATTTTTTTGYSEYIEKGELANTMGDVESQDYRHAAQKWPEKINERTSTTNKSSQWSPHNLEIFQRPMCLISSESETNEIGEETTIVLKNEERTIQQIRQIEWPMVVVAVVGLYRTGKSYLMNRLANSTKGFALGNTIQSKTKGIWAWCIIHPDLSNTVLLLLDTEGLGDVDKSDPSHDNKIFTLATLLCNCLVYNMKGVFDSDAIAKLTFVTEMAKNIRFRGDSSEDNETLGMVLPDFVLCLRDFSLLLEKDGQEISENEYLEDCIAEKATKAKHFNKVRKCIREFFQERKCFAFPAPGDTSVLEKLDSLSLSDLSDRFREKTTRFVKFIYSKPPKELLASIPVNGQVFVTLVDRYVTAIKHGAVPDVDDAFTAVAKIENDKIEKEAMEKFENQIRNVTLPAPGNDLRRLFTDAQETALTYLLKNVVFDKSDQSAQQAKFKMDTIWTKIEKDNEGKVKEMCGRKLKECFKKNLEEKIENRDYEIAGGYLRFQRDVEILWEDYRTVLGNFDESEILWTWHGFVKSMIDTKRKIVEADEILTKTEKEEEQRRNKENIENILKNQEKAKQEEEEKRKKDLESLHKKLQEDRIEQEKIKREKYEALAREKLNKEAAEKEIDRYKKEEEERKKKWFGTRIWNAFWNM